MHRVAPTIPIAFPDAHEPAGVLYFVAANFSGDGEAPNGYCDKTIKPDFDFINFVAQEFELPSLHCHQKLSF